MARCPGGTLSIGGRLCAICPPVNPLGAVQAQNYFLQQSPYRPGGSRPNPTIYRSQTDPNHIGKKYCGSEPYIIDATIYDACHPGSGFVNPYGYDRLGAPLDCMNIGRNVGSAGLGDGGGGRGGRGDGGGGDGADREEVKYDGDDGGGVFGDDGDGSGLSSSSVVVIPPVSSSSSSSSSLSSSISNALPLALIPASIPPSSAVIISPIIPLFRRSSRSSSSVSSSSLSNASAPILVTDGPAANLRSKNRLRNGRLRNK